MTLSTEMPSPLQSGKLKRVFCFLSKCPTLKNVVSWTTVVLGYARNDLVNEARRMFDRIPEKNMVAWTAMLKAYVDNDRIDDAFRFFNQMPQRNLFSWNIMISACLKAREYFDQMLVSKDIAAWNAMISARVDEGEMMGIKVKAFKNLILMLRSGCMPNKTIITSMLTICDSISELGQIHAFVSPLGFEYGTSLANTLIAAYSRTGDLDSARLAFQCWYREGHKLFDSAHTYGLQPRVEHYSCLVDILGRAGQLDKAMCVVKQMSPCERNDVVLGALLLHAQIA
ncbi:hypothetical protein F3Y22_tig00116962pilonHSYRG01113 [Hibiscus syriacus]|uniref:Pentatricopeptide repeat-containing protein n=1 Tax=Hibiscus syriacus TaxID=106335 RepID=A0A6A2WJP2_HIBSY|nr:hypothetical protein F3Y22_tig00116962pilonHSYRG01113 [Hibiscus syriacus]